MGSLWWGKISTECLGYPLQSLVLASPPDEKIYPYPSQDLTRVSIYGGMQSTIDALKATEAIRVDLTFHMEWDATRLTGVLQHSSSHDIGQLRNEPAAVCAGGVA